MAAVMPTERRRQIALAEEQKAGSAPPRSARGATIIVAARRRWSSMRAPVPGDQIDTQGRDLRARRAAGPHGRPGSTERPAGACSRRGAARPHPGYRRPAAMKRARTMNAGRGRPQLSGELDGVEKGDQNGRENEESRSARVPAMDFGGVAINRSFSGEYAEAKSETGRKVTKPKTVLAMHSAIWQISGDGAMQ